MKKLQFKQIIFAVIISLGISLIGFVGSVSASPITVFVGSYGATSGDLTDDSVAIQAALDAVKANVGGGTVTLLTNGSYIISTPLKIGKDVLLQGNSAVIKRTGAFGEEMVALEGDNASVYQLIVDGNNLSLRGIQVRNNVQHADLYLNTVKNITQGGLFTNDLTAGIFVGTGADYVNIDQNTIQNISAINSPYVSRGIMFTTYGGVIAQHANVSSNTISNVTPKDDGDGIYFDYGTNASVGSVVRWNTLHHVAKRGIKISSSGVTVSYNHITNSYNSNNVVEGDDPAEGFDMYSAISVYADNVTVSNNTVDGVGSFYAAIEAAGISDEDYVNNLSISDNGIYSGVRSDSAIRLHEVSNFSIQGNIIDNSNRGLYTFGNGRTGLIDDNTITNTIVGLSLETYIANKYLDHVTVSNNTITATTDISNASVNTNMTFTNNN